MKKKNGDSQPLQGAVGSCVSDKAGWTGCVRAVGV